MPLHPEQTIEFYPFTCQPDKDGFIVGRPQTLTYLALPEEGVRILSWLQSGRTIKETAALYEQAYGEHPDLEDFLAVIEESGLIKTQDLPSGDIAVGQTDLTGKGAPLQPQLVQYHMTWLSESLAKACFSHLAMWFLALFAASALCVLAIHTEIFPSRSDMVFETNTSLFLIAFLLFQLGSVMLHEIGHLAAARSKGVQARFGFGNRLWIIVAETDLTGIWSIPRKDRVLPLLGGPMVDVLLLSGGTFLLLGLDKGAVIFPGQWAQFTKAMYLFLCFRLLWQCYFFVRTDFYYIFTTAFECKNLLQDTQTYVMNRLKRFLGIGGVKDQSAISDREMKVIQAYSWIWGIGRILALFVLFFYILPILWSYLVIFYKAFSNVGNGKVLPMLDSLLVIGISSAIYGMGFVMWGRSLFRSIFKRERTT